MIGSCVDHMVGYFIYINAKNDLIIIYNLGTYI